MGIVEKRGERGRGRKKVSGDGEEKKVSGEGEEKGEGGGEEIR